MPYWTDLWFLTLGCLKIPSAFRARLYGYILEQGLLSRLSLQLGSAIFFGVRWHINTHHSPLLTDLPKQKIVGYTVNFSLSLQTHKNDHHS